MLNKRQVFEKVKTHLLAQGRKSEGVVHSVGWQCRYRGPMGESCAIGCLFPNSLYSERLEGLCVSDPNVVGVLKKIVDPNCLDMLTALQNIHDNVQVEDWRNALDIFEEIHLSPSSNRG